MTIQQLGGIVIQIT